ncbi:MAG: sigma 54-interacting transcriptional regulator [Fusobacteriaceae bacterium]
MIKLEKLVDPLSKILELDIEVVDKKNIRLVSTGIYKEKKYEESQEQMYKRVIEDKSIKIIENPRNNIECRRCLYSGECSKTILVALPILVKNDVVGVISFFSFNRETREKILSKIEEYINLFRELSGRIGEFFFRSGYFEIYSELFQNMSKGVVITDDKGIILEYNKEAHRAFITLKELIGKKIIISPINRDGYLLQIGNVKLDVTGKLVHLNNRKNYLIFKIIQERKEDSLPDGLLLGKSKVIVGLKKKFQNVIKNDSPILIRGEIGTDKEMFSRWIHNFSSRCNGIYLSINCREENEEKLEKKIFGIDIDENLQIGLLEGANGGTLFIEEIEYLPLHLQKKLLYYLKTSKVSPINSEREIDSDVRIITSSKEELLDKVEKGEFLENLYYKINTTDIEIPSLRYRKDDLEDIIEYILERKGKLKNKNILKIEVRAKKVLLDYEWRGNWKEIEGVLDVLVDFVEDDGVLKYENIPEKIKYNTSNYLERKNKKIKKLSELEREEIISAIYQYGEDTEAKKIIAKKLGIGIATLYRKIENYQIDKKK